MRFRRFCLFFLLGFLPPLLAWGVLVEPDLLIVRKWSVQSPNWPQNAPDLRLLLIADPHPGSLHIDRAKLERAVAMANAEKPDLVVLMGDYLGSGLFSRFIAPEVTAAILGQLKAKIGVYTILGNHDWWYDGIQVTKAFEKAGIKVLENQAVPLLWEGHEIWLAGLGDLVTRKVRIEETLARIPQKATVILAMHHPDSFPEIPAHIALSLGAHTHGGQVNLPLIGRPIVPSRHGQRYAYGVVEEGKGPMVVSGGLGTSMIPIRIGVIPEITLITLKAPPPR
ncbi:MAG: metallophosphoesterase [Alphaproteobacteria bacterium]|nr:metallophosphoesterase [Alphaproteobacteria bacterium]